ncbi:unannotated protein [freshwater metagenome]|uniref:Unannotated protein n=1 Tax=freshwater metagenome TaxID=449393 RepID=A0A6J7ELH2_9ZZZZ|nr:hypothetical protein [Actinomycetota bacterium]
MKIFNSLNELIFPPRCISCRELGQSLCISCRKSWVCHPYRSNVRHGKEFSLSVTSSIVYSPIAQKVLLAAKESDIKMADIFVSDAITYAIRNAFKEMPRDILIDSLIPIPSRKSAARKRGRQFISDMTAPAAAEFGIPIISPISHSRVVRDQTGLHFEQRWNNLHGAFVVASNVENPHYALLVDDLVTTGATLLEAARALSYAGITVVGAVTAVVAQPVRLRD